MLILLRHGQTEVNASGRLQGRSDAGLTELGHEQARAAIEAVSPAEPVRVVCSPLRRARETAEYFGRPLEIDERWIELDYGELEGRPVGEVRGAEWDRWRRDPSFAPPGGESLVDLGARVRDACADLVADAMERDVVVVSHVSPIKAAVAWALGVGDEVAFRMFLDLASICRIAVRDRGPTLIAYNESRHLPGRLPVPGSG